MAAMRKVSIVALAVRNRMCLNASVMTTPKNTPIKIDTIASARNWPIMIQGVLAVNGLLCMLRTTLNSTMDTMSLKIPSPKMQEYSLG